MGNLIADIFVTIKPTEERADLTFRSLESLLEKTKRDSFRLTICTDGSFPRYWSPKFFLDSADYVLRSKENTGLGPTINRAIAHIKSINDWHSDPQVGDSAKIAPYIVMCQDDILYTENWLHTLATRFQAYKIRHALGFATGHYAIEHAKTIRGTLDEGMHLQNWIRATNVLGTREYWQSLMPITTFDPETGRLRAKPNDGVGSSVDWWLIRNHENSICRAGLTCLVIPGLVQHIGFQKSTWFDRELPESDLDKEKIKNG